MNFTTPSAVYRKWYEGEIKRLKQSLPLDHAPETRAWIERCLDKTRAALKAHKGAQ